MSSSWSAKAAEATVSVAMARIAVAVFFIGTPSGSGTGRTRNITGNRGLDSCEGCNRREALRSLAQPAEGAFGSPGAFVQRCRRVGTRADVDDAKLGTVFALEGALPVSGLRGIDAEDQRRGRALEALERDQQRHVR